MKVLQDYDESTDNDSDMFDMGELMEEEVDEEAMKNCIR